MEIVGDSRLRAASAADKDGQNKKREKRYRYLKLCVRIARLVKWPADILPPPRYCFPLPTSGRAFSPRDAFWQRRWCAAGTAT